MLSCIFLKVSKEKRPSQHWQNTPVVLGRFCSRISRSATRVHAWSCAFAIVTGDWRRIRSPDRQRADEKREEMSRTSGHVDVSRGSTELPIGSGAVAKRLPRVLWRSFFFWSASVFCIDTFEVCGPCGLRYYLKGRCRSRQSWKERERRGGGVVTEKAMASGPTFDFFFRRRHCE